MTKVPIQVPVFDRLTPVEVNIGAPLKDGIIQVGILGSDNWPHARLILRRQDNRVSVREQNGLPIQTEVHTASFDIANPNASNAVLLFREPLTSLNFERASSEISTDSTWHFLEGDQLIANHKHLLYLASVMGGAAVERQDDLLKAATQHV